MKTKLSISDKEYTADLSKPIDISIRISDGSSPIAFHAPQVSFEPLQAGEFIGSIEEGSPVNFYNIKLNPHGNGTHTETVRHIVSDGPFIADTIKPLFYRALLISVEPKNIDGDTILHTDCFEFSSIDFDDLDAIIIRTLPNTKEKLHKNYSDTNPTYISKELAEMLGKNVDHLLIDLPSVDREKDGGKVASHHLFWDTQGDKNYHKTITELIYVDSEIDDGLYLLNIHCLPLELDASPSRPIIYRLHPK